MPASPDTTRLLLDLRKGDGSARDELLTLVYDELCDLAARHMLEERHHRVVELRFFGGLTIRQTALVLGVAPNTVNAD